LAVIVVSFFESVVRDHSKDHPVTAAYIDDTLTRKDPYTTLPDLTWRRVTLAATCLRERIAHR
jgi:hypothetical protein